MNITYEGPEFKTIQDNSEFDVLLLMVQGVSLLYFFMVNGTNLIGRGMDGGKDTGSPESPFPYRRLGGFSPDNGSVLYLYHQINSTTFAEDHWNQASGFWDSTNFTISGHGG